MKNLFRDKKCQNTSFNLHALLSDKLLSNPAASGHLLAIPVGIGKSVNEPPAIPQLLDEIFGQILDNEEIAALHEGNFARYRLCPTEFNDWQKRKKQWPPASDISQVFRVGDIFTICLTISRIIIVK